MSLKKINRQYAAPKKEKGAVLIISLIFLLLLTVIGLSAVRDASLQERMAGNARDLNSAFQAAEAALRQAEGYLQGATVGPFTGQSGLYKYCSLDATSTACTVPDWKVRGSTGWASLSADLSAVSSRPHYIIQQIPIIADQQGSLVSDGPVETYEVYRITARGFGSSDASMVVLQSSYRRG